MKILLYVSFFLLLANFASAQTTSAQAGFFSAPNNLRVSLNIPALPALNNRPYSADSPWNLKIGPNPTYDPNSATYMAMFEDKGHLGADTSRYTMPVYPVSAKTPVRQVHLSGVFSEVTQGGKMLETVKDAVVEVPIPDGALQAQGSDAQIILWNPETGDEWGFWRAQLAGDHWVAVNGYSYNTNWSGVPPTGFVSRGAGVPYLIGLIRPWEIEQGRIEHAIAFAFNNPSARFVHPATKSDGEGYGDLPEGARLQLDPSLTETDFDRWGLSKVERIIARAMQEYGLVVIDRAGHPKFYAEYEDTAGWNGLINNNTLRRVPYGAFRVLSLTTPDRPSQPDKLEAVRKGSSITLTWRASKSANRYRISRRADTGEYAVIASDMHGTSFTDAKIKLGVSYEYVVQGVSHNGISQQSEPVRIKP